MKNAKVGIAVNIPYGPIVKVVIQLENATDVILGKLFLQINWNVTKVLYFD